MATINGVEVIGDKSAHDYDLLDKNDGINLSNGIETNREAAEDNHSDIVRHRTDTDVHVTPEWKNSLVTKEILGLYWTAAQTADIINEISIAGGAKLVKVETLPAVGLEQTIYLVPKQDPQAGDVFDEYVWIDNKFEFIGTTKANLSNYYTKTEVDTELVNKANTSDLSAVATSGSYNDLSDKPTIPTVNNATLTIQKNGTTVETFTANASSNVTADIAVPTKTSELTNDSGFLTTHNPVDNALSSTSANAVQNKVVNTALNAKANASDLVNYLPKTTTLESLSSNSIPFHNAYPRCKYLGTSITDAQNEAIKNRTYDDLFIGDYWTINGINWRIVTIDYYYNIGDVNFDKGNIIVMPDTVLYNAPMNETDITVDAYAGSLMRTQNLNNARTIAQNAFGSHLANHRILLANNVDASGPSNCAWFDSDGTEIPNEVQIYGTRAWGSTLKGYDVATQKYQFPLMALAPQFVNIRQSYWLQDVSSYFVSSRFAYVRNGGFADAGNASSSFGVRPAVTLSYS